MVYSRIWKYRKSRPGKWCGSNYCTGLPTLQNMFLILQLLSKLFVCTKFTETFNVINQKHFQTLKHVFQKGKNSYAGFFLSETGFFFQFQKLEKIWWELAWYLRKTTKMIGGYLTGRWCLTVTVRHIFFIWEINSVFFYMKL